MGGDVPKQYLRLGGRTVIEHTLDQLANHPAISGLVVVLGADDGYWPELRLTLKAPLWVAPGGSERCHSVLNGLAVLAGIAQPDDWVMVHDAARPCLRREDVDLLIEKAANHPVGGLLGLPISDTIKRADGEGGVIETVDRSGLWRALTPQMFRLGALKTALESALREGYLVTDEASAMEHAGQRPLMVEGHGDNIKITRPADLPLAELYLTQQERR